MPGIDRRVPARAGAASANADGALAIACAAWRCLDSAPAHRAVMASMPHDRRRVAPPVIGATHALSTADGDGA
jgi:hypothetical protein